MKAKTKKQIESDILSKYLIYGEHLNTQDLLEREAKHFYNYLNKNTDPSKTIPKLIWGFAETRTWWNTRQQGSNAGNLKALERAFLCIYFYGVNFLKTVASSPDREREKISERYRRQQSKLSKPVSPGQLREIDKWSEERDKILPSRILNNQEYSEWIKINKPIFIIYNKAWGFKTCEASDCIQHIPLEKSKRKYCSDVCKDKEKSRRWRIKNPAKKLKSNFKYLKSLKKAGDI